MITKTTIESDNSTASGAPQNAENGETTPAPVAVTNYHVIVEGRSIPGIPASLASDNDRLIKALAPAYPWVDGANFKRQQTGDTVTITVTKRAGPKGDTETPLRRLIACEGRQNPVIEIYVELRELDLDALSPEEMLTLDQRIDEAMTEGQKQHAAVKKARQRLGEARPQRAPLTVLGF